MVKVQTAATSKATTDPFQMDMTPPDGRSTNGDWFGSDPQRGYRMHFPSDRAPVAGTGQDPSATPGPTHPEHATCQRRDPVLAAWRRRHRLPTPPAAVAPQWRHPRSTLDSRGAR